VTTEACDTQGVHGIVLLFLNLLIELPIATAGAWACGQIARRYGLPRGPLMVAGFIGTLLTLMILVVYVRIRYRAQRRAGLV